MRRHILLRTRSQGLTFGDSVSHLVDWILVLFLPAATKLGQGNIFTSVCQEFCTQGGVCLSVCWDAPPEQTPPWEQTSPQTRHYHPHPPPPGSRHPKEHTPPVQTPPPTPDQTPAYGQRVAGTHGMHSCFGWRFNFL